MNSFFHIPDILEPILQRSRLPLKRLNSCKDNDTFDLAKFPFLLFLSLQSPYPMFSGRKAYKVKMRIRH